MDDEQFYKKVALAISSGNQNIFRDFYHHYVKKVFRFAGYFFKAEEIKQEIVSDVFVSIWLNRKSFYKINNINAYLFILTKNISLNYLKKYAREPEYISELPLTFFNTGETPEDIFINEELKSFIKLKINSLPEKCKMVFILSREKELKYKDIAEMLNISEKTVNAHMVSALKKMHDAINEYMHEKK